MLRRSGDFVDVFPINSAVFELKANWYETYVPKLIHPSFLLMVLLLVVFIGVAVLKRFDGVELEKKLWNIPTLLVIITVWPLIISGLKDLIDTFDTFLVRDVFQIPWNGFGFPSLGSVRHIFGWTADSIDRLLPNFAYWIVYAFYIVQFFFLAVLGPFILAKGIFQDEIDGFLSLVKEISTLFMWQTMIVILVAMIMPDIVSGQPLPENSDSSFFFLSIMLSVMMLFSPSMTRKFSTQIGGASIFPKAFHLGGAMLAFGAISKVASAGASVTGLSGGKIIEKVEWASHKLASGEHFRKRYENMKDIQDLQIDQQNVNRELNKEETLRRDDKNDLLVEHLKKAKKEMEIEA